MANLGCLLCYVTEGLEVGFTAGITEGSRMCTPWRADACRGVGSAESLVEGLRKPLRGGYGAAAPATSWLLL